MKTLAIAFVILGSSLFNNTYAKGNLTIKEQLKKVVKFENNQLAIDKNETEFVKVSFKINEEGKIQIIDANYSNEIIKEQLIQKLNALTINEQHDIEQVYYYNFTFQKR